MVPMCVKSTDFQFTNAMTCKHMLLGSLIIQILGNVKLKIVKETDHGCADSNHT